jgi:hypothetical protein
MPNTSSTTQTFKPPIKNSFQLAISTVRERGIRGLYAGHFVNTIREMVFLATYFSVYEHSKASFLAGMPSAVAVPMAGGVSGSLGWLISFPLDCIKANIQGVRYMSAADRAPGTLEVTRMLLRTKGIIGLYSGVFPSIARAFIVSSSRFSAYEVTMWTLG